MWPTKFLLFNIFVTLFSVQTALKQKFPDDNGHLQQTLSRILIPRTVGTPGHTAVYNFIRRELSELGFITEVDEFIATTPIFGSANFTNIIGTINPNANNFLVLACHYDSKYFPDYPDFVAAVDSAVSCSIILNVAKTLSSYLQHPKFQKQTNIGLKAIFFDGEEAIQNWSSTDSLYGSKHLADKLLNTRSFIPRGAQTPISEISRIAVLVLLDLIGAENPMFTSQFINTNELHQQLSKIESKFSNSSILEGRNKMFINQYSPNFIQDDHIPFLEKGVSVLHLIPNTFPQAWHKPIDDADHLHWPTIRDFNKVFRQFVYEYLTVHSGTVNLRAFPSTILFSICVVIKYFN